VYDAIVLAGGRARRLGGVAKPQLTVGGRTLLDAVVAAVAGAQRVVVVGPEQPVAGPVVWRRESPPGGGPVAAIRAGVPATAAPVVLVLAADLPAIAPAVPLLLAAVPADGAAVLTDRADPAGPANYLAAAWRRSALVAALTTAGTSVRSLLAAVPVVAVPDTGGWGQDCDTWDDLARARFEEGRADA
jgi:molybdopterin-guanine dinucleotide biosynthesis protein A